jgi:hypothetical protein
MKNYLFYFICWTWCLPQSLFGLLLYIFVKLVDKGTIECRYHTGTWLVKMSKLPFNVSLGYFIFTYNTGSENFKTEQHEWGHTLQGFLLGPLYLIVIGLPSFIWAAFFGKYRKENNVSYYSFYTESWADAWSRVKRDG